MYDAEVKRVIREILTEDPVWDAEQYDLYMRANDNEPEAVNQLKTQISDKAWNKRIESDKRNKANKFKNEQYSCVTTLINKILQNECNPKESKETEIRNFFQNPGNADFHVTYGTNGGNDPHARDQWNFYATVPASENASHSRQNVTFILTPRLIANPNNDRKIGSYWLNDTEGNYFLETDTLTLFLLCGIDDETIREYAETIDVPGYDDPTEYLTTELVYNALAARQRPLADLHHAGWGYPYHELVISPKTANIIKNVVEFVLAHEKTEHSINHTARGRKSDIKTNPEMPKYFKLRRS